MYQCGVVVATEKRPYQEGYYAALQSGCNLWFFQNDAIWCNGYSEGYFSPGCMEPGDIVTLELERRVGCEGVMRVKANGRPTKQMAGLPSEGVLHPVVNILNRLQSVTISLNLQS